MIGRKPGRRPGLRSMGRHSITLPPKASAILASIAMKEHLPKKVKQARRKAGEPLQALNWAFTFYPHKDEDVATLKALANASPKPYLRLAFGDEICPRRAGVIYKAMSVFRPSVRVPPCSACSRGRVPVAPGVFDRMAQGGLLLQGPQILDGRRRRRRLPRR